MNTTNKVIFNTVVLYAKIIVTMLISLVSVPLILKALGTSDYGLYNLVAGVVAMLSFLNASMSVSTQRYLSVAIGSNDSNKLNTIFNCAVLLHLLIGIGLVVIFELCGLFLFDGFLNIPIERIPTAKIIYQFIIVSTFFSVMTVPYGAVMNAKENMLAFSIIDIIDSLLKLALALYLTKCSFDRLIFYGAGIACIAILNVIFNRLFVRIKYKEFCFVPRKYYSSDTFKSMLGFAGWNTFGSVANIGRNQGIAIVMNLFLGTTINAAYGVANQVNGILAHFAATFNRAINPQLMQSEGMGDRNRLSRISFISSKISFIVMAFFGIPLIIEMPYVIDLWLGSRAPEYTVIFSRLIIILSLIYQYSNGLMSAAQAVGNIGRYQVTMGSLLILNVPICYCLLKFGLPAYSCLICFITIEIICLIVRMQFAHNLAGINKFNFFREVIFTTIASVFISGLVIFMLHIFMPESFLRLALVCIIYVITFIFFLWRLSLNSDEKQACLMLINSLKTKIHHKL